MLNTPEFVANPHPVLASLRESAPVSRVVWHGMPAWLVTRFAEAQEAYTSPHLSASKEYASPALLEVPWAVGSARIGLGSSMIHVDPPRHTRLRKLVTRSFTARRVEDLREFTTSVASSLVSSLLARGGGDIIRDFSVPLACRVIMALMGVSPSAASEFRDHTYVFLSTDPADQARIPEALTWITSYIQSLIASKRASPADDLTSALAVDASLDDAELGSMMILLLMAGFETTASLIGNGLLTLLTFPSSLSLLRSSPSLIPSAVEEMLRYEGAALASLPKFAKEDFLLGGTTIRRGEAVIVSWPAANRDPRRFTSPDTFDVRRSEGTHLGFAHGIRYCLGAPLARMEAQVAFASLLSRRISLATSSLEWRMTPNVRGLRALPVTVS